MNTVEISVLIAVVGCFVGLAGWISGRDKRIAGDAEWKGTVNTKLDSIIDMNKIIVDHEKRITECEQASKTAHQRIQRMEERER